VISNVPFENPGVEAVDVILALQPAFGGVEMLNVG
jgi:hypothetical protein